MKCLRRTFSRQPSLSLDIIKSRSCLDVNPRDSGHEASQADIIILSSSTTGLLDPRMSKIGLSGTHSWIYLSDRIVPSVELVKLLIGGEDSAGSCQIPKVDMFGMEALLEGF